MNAQQPYSLYVVEDNEDDRMLAELALRKVDAQFPVEFYQNAGSAMDALSGLYKSGGELPGAILLDLNMPGKDGKAMLGELRADPAFSRIAVVMLTTSSADVDARDCYEAGCSAYFVKPYSVTALTEILQSIVHHWLSDSFVAPPTGTNCWGSVSASSGTR